MRLNRFLFLLICVIGEGVFSNQIEFTADRYETNLKTKTTVIEGNVELKYQSKVLNADKVTVLAESGAVEGVGEVSFIDEDLKFTAERAKFNIKNRLGKFWNYSLKHNSFDTILLTQHT